jgi:hypothetical protein
MTSAFRVGAARDIRARLDRSPINADAIDIPDMVKALHTTLQYVRLRGVRADVNVVPAG